MQVEDHFLLNFLFIYFGFFFSFFWLCCVLVVGCGVFNLCCSMQDLYLWHAGFSSLVRDQTWVHCIGSTGS